MCHHKSESSLDVLKLLTQKMVCAFLKLEADGSECTSRSICDHPEASYLCTFFCCKVNNDCDLDLRLICTELAL